MNITKIKGTVKFIGATTEVGQNGFTKREVVIDTAAAGSNYPSLAVCELKKDKCALGDTICVGSEVEADITFDGREWNGRYFNGLTLWKIAVTGGAKPDAGDRAPTCATGKAFLDYYTKVSQLKGDGLKNALAAFCKLTIPGKASKDYTAGDWQKCADSLYAETHSDDAARAEAEDAAAAAAADEAGLPF